ncbi:probable rhamnogalacturonate lyase B isoform X1 [Salvia miltiorrhiza]|uniref:probable rhamnogalacturonate lyase B isoform X1 n=2 Tax=Salvia miltiorrhiza TaxID=226208 RepID=UPI0025ABF9FA|nr:probable rhamnogalacturonate lyase B isoform X1 [Salvia miltiorrhiza]
MARQKKCGWNLRWLAILLQTFLLAQCAASRWQKIHQNEEDDEIYYPPVQLHDFEDHIVLDNGILNVTLSTPEGMITKITYNGIHNLLEQEYNENNRGYWDLVWSSPDHPTDIFDKLDGTNLFVIREDEDQVEVSFVRTWDSSQTGLLPLNIDKRFIMLRGCPGFYSYAIFERLQGWPDLHMSQGRIVFKLQQNLFEYMAISDDRQRVMPTSEDRNRSQVLDYPEAVLLTNPTNAFLRGEVDDKYQYSSDNKDSQVHGWIAADPPTGFWIITPSNEFKTAGPLKQDLTSHAGPIALSMFFSTHYAGVPLVLDFRGGEPWKKVFGPVFVYLNSVSPGEDPLALWPDAKEQMMMETKQWPYDFPMSEDFPPAKQRGRVSGRLLVRDRYMSERLMTASSAYIGVARPGDPGSWQRENKGYQFWSQCDALGYFRINNIRAGNYSLYAWLPGIIGDYKYNIQINIKPGSKIRLRNVVYDPPRDGPTLWEIGIPDRSAAEFYVPDPNPTLLNQLYTVQPDKFRQYGLWDRYTDLYPDQDLVYSVESSIYQTDWYFAHVNRNIGNKTYVPTTWRILFNLTDVDTSANYTLRLALASANDAELQVRINGEEGEAPCFTTGLIGKDNAIARHGIHGLYWLYSVCIGGSVLQSSTNIILLTQSRGSSPWKGIMYDYIRLEGPSSNTQT